ncbi:MAG: BrnT family toxin [Burkholderiales bacterium]|nr:BrnT family toxin [Burkholderiales bacterium]MDP2398461.1 BrnT family toxin [Burkholderiales bacterium]
MKNPPSGGFFIAARNAHRADTPYKESKINGQESRFHALGKTHEGRTMHVTFTMRQDNTLIRVISARDMHRKERSIYEQAS